LVRVLERSIVWGMFPRFYALAGPGRLNCFLVFHLPNGQLSQKLN
jgi:hypothetical protein